MLNGDWLEGKKKKVQQLHLRQLVMLEAACVGGLLLGLTLAAAGLGVLPIFLDRVSAFGLDERSSSTVPGTVLTELELTQRLRATDRLKRTNSLGFARADTSFRHPRIRFDAGRLRAAGTVVS